MSSYALESVNYGVKKMTYWLCPKCFSHGVRWDCPLCCPECGSKNLWCNEYGFEAHLLVIGA